MSELIGQPIVVENKPGAATNLGADFVANHLARTTRVLLFSRRQIFALQNFIADLTREDKRKLLDPKLAANGISIKVAKTGSKSSVTVGLEGATKIGTLPVSPELLCSNGLTTLPFKSLDSVFVTERNKLADKDWEEFKRKVERAKCKGQLDQLANVKFEDQEIYS
jgi:hypothetical protein